MDSLHPIRKPFDTYDIPFHLDDTTGLNELNRVSIVTKISDEHQVVIDL